MMQMRQWSEQLDELAEQESYEEALALLETIDKATLPDKVRHATLDATTNRF